MEGGHLHVHSQILLHNKPLLVALSASEGLVALEMAAQIVFFRLVLCRELFVAILAFDRLRRCGFGGLYLRLPRPMRGHVEDQIHLTLKYLRRHTRVSVAIAAILIGRD